MNKKTCLLIVLIVAAFTFPAAAQLNVGLIGGPHFAGLNVDILDMEDDLSLELDNMIYYGIGGMVDIPILGGFGLRLEPMFLKRGGKLESQLPIELPNASVSYTASYVELPVMLRFEFGRLLRPYILAGPTVGYLVDASLTLSAMGIGVRADVNQITKSIHFGFTYGIGVHYPTQDFSLFIEWRYTAGLYNIIQDGPVSFNFAGERIEETIVDDDIEMKTKGSQVMFGISVPLLTRSPYDG